MDSERIRSIIQTAKAEKDDAAASRERQQQRYEEERLFRTNWFLVYPSILVENWHKTVADRLLRLAPAIIERHWDYVFADMLSLPNLNGPFEITLRILKNVCQAQCDELERCLLAASDGIQSVSISHNELLGICENRIRTEWPPTPPMNQKQMAQALGITIDEFRYQHEKLKKWRMIDNTRRHARSWVAIEPTNQSDLLRSIRAKFPEKIWEIKSPDSENPGNPD